MAPAPRPPTSYAPLRPVAVRRFRPVHGVRNASSLFNALRNATVRGIRLSELEKNTYATEEVEKDIKRLIDEGAVVAIPRSDLPAIGPRKGEKVWHRRRRRRRRHHHHHHHHNHPHRRRQMLFAASKIERASDELRDLWHGARVPSGDLLTAELVRAGKRSAAELEVHAATSTPHVEIVVLVVAVVLRHVPRVRRRRARSGRWRRGSVGPSCRRSRPSGDAA